MVLNVEKIVTQNESGINGWMMPFAKTLDPFWNGYEIKYIYATSILPLCRKGPILHKKRECRLLPIVGRCIVVIRKDGAYKEHVLDFDNPSVLAIEAGDPFCVYNDSLSECILINVANHCWTKEDQDAHMVDDWNYEVNR